MDKLEKKNKFDGSLCFKTKDFYRLTGRARQSEIKEEEEIFKRFGDPATGLIKDKYLRSRSCICGSGDAMALFIKYGFRFVICNKCGFLYVNPILKENQNNQFYKNEDSWFEVLQNSVQSEMDRLKFAYGLGMIEEYAQKGSLLDVGCGNSSFMEVAAERGWNCTGIEFNSKGLEIAKAKGLKVTNTDIYSPFFEDKKFDLITLWEVLEHVCDPRAMLQRVNYLLNPKGLVFILVPNRDSLINRMLREKSNSFTGHCHVNFFNAKLLKNLLKDEGFNALSWETLISELGNIRNYLNYENAYYGEPGEDTDFFTPSFIHDNLLGCKLLVLAQKNNDPRKKP